MKTAEFDRYMAEITARWPFRTPEARDDYARELWAFGGELEGEGFRRAVHECVEKFKGRPAPASVARMARMMARPLPYQSNAVAVSPEDRAEAVAGLERAKAALGKRAGEKLAEQRSRERPAAPSREETDG